MVGHRLSLGSMADRIVVMEAGAVTDTGSHAELLSSDGWYARACRRREAPTHRQPPRSLSHGRCPVEVDELSYT